MRFAYLGSFENDWDTEAYIARALERAKHTVYRMHEPDYTADRIDAECRIFQPDVFLFAKGRVLGEWEPSCERLRLTTDLLRARFRKIRVACWVFDLLAKEFADDRWEWANNAANLCDVFFTTDGYTAKQITNAVVLRQGVPDDVVTQVPGRASIARPEWQKDVLFLGYPYRDRGEVVGRLHAIYGDRFLHISDGVRGSELSALMASVKVVVGLNYPRFAHYWSNRIYVVTGHGGCFVAPLVEGMRDEGWVSGLHFLGYRNEEGMFKGINHLLNHGAKRERIRAAGQEHAKRFTYDARVQFMVDRLRSIG